MPGGDEPRSTRLKFLPGATWARWLRHTCRQGHPGPPEGCHEEALRPAHEVISIISVPTETLALSPGCPTGTSPPHSPPLRKSLSQMPIKGAFLLSGGKALKPAISPGSSALLPLWKGGHSAGCSRGDHLHCPLQAPGGQPLWEAGQVGKVAAWEQVALEPQLPTCWRQGLRQVPAW